MPTVLVIEDKKNNLYLMKFLLQTNGFDFIEASDGLAGVELATRKKPDLILMDIQLPGIDGLEATRRLKSKEETKDIIIIALTSYAMAGDRKKALDAGCDGYLEKPINPDIFIAEIKKYLTAGGK